MRHADCPESANRLATPARPSSGRSAGFWAGRSAGFSGPPNRAGVAGVRVSGGTFCMDVRMMRIEATPSNWSVSSTISARASPVSSSTASASARPSIQAWPAASGRMNSTRSCAVSVAPPPVMEDTIAAPQQASASTANVPGSRPPSGAVRYGDAGTLTTAVPASTLRMSMPRVS
jgi:hypothetical protein